MGGSLADLLHGEQSDLLSGNDSDDQQNGQEGRAIIQFHQINEDEDDDDDDEDDEDNGTEAVLLIKQWAKSRGDESSLGSSSSVTNGGNNAPKDALRQNCITALRNLCNQGSISPKQKRVLLTDIIA